MANDRAWFEQTCEDEEYPSSNMEAAMMAYEFERYMQEQEEAAEFMRVAADMRRKEIKECGA
jgi:hypothetical protein